MLSIWKLPQRRANVRGDHRQACRQAEATCCLSYIFLLAAIFPNGRAEGHLAAKSRYKVKNVHAKRQPVAPHAHNLLLSLLVFRAVNNSEQS